MIINKIINSKFVKSRRNTLNIHEDRRNKNVSFQFIQYVVI